MSVCVCSKRPRLTDEEEAHDVTEDDEGDEGEVPVGSEDEADLVGEVNGEKASDEDETDFESDSSIDQDAFHPENKKYRRKYNSGVY